MSACDENDPVPCKTQAELDAEERAKPVVDRVADEAEQVSSDKTVYVGAIATVIAVLVTTCAAVAIHGVQ